MRLGIATLVVATAALPAFAESAAPTMAPALAARPTNSSERIQALIGQLIIQAEQQRDQIEVLTRELSQARGEIARLKEEAPQSKPNSPK
jgi:Spy/CpxP family protein refolding chaperone